MELDEHGFLEEFLSLKRDTWEDDFFSTEGSFAPLCFTSMDGVGMFPDPLSFDCLSEVYRPFEPVTLTDLQFSAAHGATHVPHQGQSPTDITLPAVGALGKKRKPDGAPSKNLMAERRRRKRLNDRLSLLRSVVPKISKMDRTSILADTIDYMKELLERIKQLREEMEQQLGTDLSNQLNMFKDMNLNGASLISRNTPNPPKFDVERRDADTRIAMCCTGKPGMLLSTLDALDALGLDIQQCVISCFNDFGMQASCSENMENRSEMMPCEGIKQVLFRSAGYSGRAL